MWNVILDALRELGLTIANIFINFMRSDKPIQINSDFCELIKNIGLGTIDLIRKIIDCYVN